MSFAAIDQGTSSTRLLIADENAEPRVLLNFPHSQHYPSKDHVEQNPLELLRNVEACICEAAGAIALGIANQGESCLAWDAFTRQPLSPVIGWQDTRTRIDLQRRKRDGIEQITLQRAGLPLSPYFSASKLGWLITELSGVRNALAHGRLRLGTTDAYLLDSLTGEFATDVSTASRTSLLNIHTLEWDPVLCDVFGIPLECLPQIRPTVAYFGSYGRLPITCSVVDQQASLFGHGCRERGDAKMTFGTGAFLLAITGEEASRTLSGGLLTTVAWQIGRKVKFAFDGGILHAGSAVTWLSSLGFTHALEQLQSVESLPAIDHGLVFVPALSGLGSPHWDPAAAGLWLGLTAGTTQLDLCQSVFEGIAFRSVEVIRACENQLFPLSSLSIDGGMARNRYFVQFLADVSERKILVRSEAELTALGCAQMAALGSGGSLDPVLREPAAYFPRNSHAHSFLQRFQSAVERAKAWRRDDSDIT